METCHICRSTAVAQRLLVREMMFGTGDTFAYRQCARCGCLQIETIPPNIGTYYPPDYYSYATKPRTAWRSLKAYLKRQSDTYAVFKKGYLGKCLFRYVSKDAPVAALSHVSITEQTRILDVGCGSGALLKSLWAIGCRNLMGADPFIAHDISDPEGPPIRKCQFTDLTQTFDLVMFHHAFEHVANPKEIFAHLPRVLAPDGICLIRIPVADSWAFRHYGPDWVQLDAPRHFFLHTQASIRLLCQSNGLTLKKVIFDSNELQFYGSEQYRRDIPLLSERSYAVHPRRSIFSAQELGQFKKKAIQLNQSGEGDQAIFLITQQKV